MTPRVLLLAPLMLGCHAHVVSALDGAPAWVRSGSGAHKDEAGPAFHGVGQAAGILHQKLRTASADAHARSDVAKVTDTFLASLLKSYGCASTACELSPEEVARFQAQTNLLRQFWKDQIAGAQIVEHWSSLDGSTEFAHVRLDYAAFKRDLLALTGLGERTREVITARIDRTFDELEEEEAQRRF